MAAPHGAGVMALWLEADPKLSPAQLHRLAQENATRDIIGNAKGPNAHMLHSRLGTGTVITQRDPEEPVTAPVAPGQLSLQLPSLGRVDLAWADLSDNESGFEIERRRGSDSWRPLVTVGANTTTYSDTSVLRDETYSYRVRAVNSAGSSAYSNVATITVACRTRGNSSTCP
jgi:serine protease